MVHCVSPVSRTVLGGVSTSILLTAFDSWMVTNFRERKLANNGGDLRRTCLQLNDSIRLLLDTYSKSLHDPSGELHGRLHGSGTCL